MNDGKVRGIWVTRLRSSHCRIFRSMPRVRERDDVVLLLQPRVSGVSLKLGNTRESSLRIALVCKLNPFSNVFAECEIHGCERLVVQPPVHAIDIR